MNPKEVTGVVLAGGQSRRMGADKASLVVGGKPMISWVIDRMKEVFPEVVVVAKSAAHLDVPGVRVVDDAVSDKSGALVGIYSALGAAQTPYVFVVACDMPHIRPELVRWMTDAYDGSDAFVPRVASQIEPLFALYSQACLPAIERRLLADDLRVRGFFEDVKTVYAAETDLRAADPNLASFVNINTREDLENVRRLMGRTGATHVPTLDVVEAEKGSYRAVTVNRVKDVGSEEESSSEAEDTVIVETEISILLNGEPVRSVQCSPHNLEDLAVGRLLSDGLIRAGQKVAATVSGLRVSLKMLEENGLSKGDVLAATPALDVTAEAICDSVEGLLGKSPLFGLTGAAHAAALCSACGIVYWSEDIGRHNAVDRVVGRCFLDGASFDDKFLVITGRINSEMVQKTAACGVRLVASKAPPTDKGIEMAERLGISLVGFVRNRRFNIYTHPEIWRRER